MLVLSRKHNESVVVGNINRADPLLKVTVLELNGSKVRLGFEADADVSVHRWEVWQRILTDDVSMGHGSSGTLRRKANACPARTCVTVE